MRIKIFRKKKSLSAKITDFFFKNKKRKQKKTKKIKYLFFLIFIIFLGIFGYGYFFLPNVEDADQLEFAESTIIYDRVALDPQENPNEHILYTIHGDENREFIPLDEISPWIKKATIAIEDDSFYSHFGFDIGGIIKASLNRFFGVGSSRGGSTITQQLVKNSFLSREKTLSRKFNELLLAIKMEWHYDKDKILELYLNKIPYGHNAHGVEAASKLFFGKSSKNLSLAESVILASLPVAPTRFSPYGSNKDMLMGFYEIDSKTGIKSYKKGRKDLVLERMLDLKMITFSQFQSALTEAKNIEFKKYREEIKAPHFVFYVRQKLEEKYGKNFLKEGGLRIYTSLDPAIQKIAEKTISTKTEHYPSTYGAKNVALVSIDNDTGEILSYVGGKDYFDEKNDGQVDVLTSRRQPGSSFKPMVYATGFTKGYSPGTVFFDVETDFGGNYTPQNFDGKFLGPVSARESLNRSLNIPAVKMAYLATPKSIIESAKNCGIKIEGSAEEHQVALGIGVAEVEPLSHINSFQVFANNGDFFDTTAILEVHNAEGNILEKADFGKKKKNCLDPEVAALVRDVLTDETTRPTTDDFDWNKLLQLENFDNGSKTGTSNRRTENPDFDPNKEEDEEENPKFITTPGDSWTIGFTPYLTSGVWVGNNRGEPMKLGATGLAVAAPIWKKFMTESHKILLEKKENKEKEYPIVDTLIKKKINKFSGKIAAKNTPPKLIKEEIFASFSVPTEIDDSVKIIRTTSRINSYNPTQKIKKYTMELQSIKPNLPNWNNPVEEWLDSHPKFLSSLGRVMDDEEEKDEEDDPDEDLKEKIFERRNRSNILLNRNNKFRRNIPNKYNQNNFANIPPQIEIFSPKDGGIVANGNLEVLVTLKSQAKIRSVLYYFDDELVAEAENFPWTGRFKIPLNIELNTNHILKAKVIDRLSSEAEDSIEIQINEDTEGPEIKFLGPVGNQRIPLNSKFEVMGEVIDFASGIKSVEFLLDNLSFGFQNKKPFKKILDANGELGRHEIKIRAWDFHGNFSEKVLPVIYEKPEQINSTAPEIQKIINYKDFISVDTFFPQPQKIEWIKLEVMQEGEIYFSQEIKNISKQIQFQVRKNYYGKSKIKLLTKFFGDTVIYKSPEKLVDL